MKIIQLITLLAFLCSILACQEVSKKDVTTTDEISMADLAVRKLNADSARTWIQRWKNNSASFMKSNFIEYFDMPIADLRAVTSQSDVKQARYYIGLEDRGKIDGLKPHLILLGLKDDNVADFNKAYDYTNVCPPLCDLVPPPGN